MRISDWSADVCSSDLVLRGSARSIPGFHVRDVLARVDAMQPGLIDRFGGHAMAAGLSLPQAHFADFEAAFLEAATAMIAPEALHETIASDGELPADAFHIHNACPLRDGGPWGQRSEEHTAELQSLIRIEYAVFCLKKKKTHACTTTNKQHPICRV